MNLEMTVCKCELLLHAPSLKPKTSRLKPQASSLIKDAILLHDFQSVEFFDIIPAAGDIVQVVNTLSFEKRYGDDAAITAGTMYIYIIGVIEISHQSDVG